MSIRTITALFDSADAAGRARERLLEVGLRSDYVQLIHQGAGGERAGSDGKGLWEASRIFSPAMPAIVTHMRKESAVAGIC